jgi:hypothetical protein
MVHKSSRTQTRSTRGIDTDEHDVERDPESFEAQTTTEATGDDVALRGTITIDSITTILEKGWINAAVCRGDYSDDPDSSLEYRRGPAGRRSILREIADSNPKACWVEQKADGRQIVTLYWPHTSFDISLDLRYAVYSFDNQPPSDDMNLPSKSDAESVSLCDACDAVDTSAVDSSESADTADTVDTDISLSNRHQSPDTPSTDDQSEWTFGEPAVDSTPDAPDRSPVDASNADASPTPEAPGAVFEQLSTGDQVRWAGDDDAAAPYTVVVGREDAQKLNGGNGPDVPTVYLEDQHGTTKTLHSRDTDRGIVTVDTPDEESDGIELVTNLRIVGRVDAKPPESDAGDRE